jgi:polar amino acid transport system substrate-binding protein
MNRLPSGMAIRKGDIDTLNVLNNWIEVNTKFIEQRQHYWFQTQEWRAQVGKGN